MRFETLEIRSNENDNGEMRQFFGMLRKIAISAKCAILVMHHSGKDGGRNTLAASRGASSVVGVVRAFRTLSELDKNDVKALASTLRPEEVQDCVRVDDVKLSHHRRRDKPIYLKRVSVDVNGESVAALQTLQPANDA